MISDNDVPWKSCEIASYILEKHGADLKPSEVREVIAAALNAWIGSDVQQEWGFRRLTLPLPSFWEGGTVL